MLLSNVRNFSGMNLEEKDLEGYSPTSSSSVVFHLELWES